MITQYQANAMLQTNVVEGQKFVALMDNAKNEITASSYKRVPIMFHPPEEGLTKNSTDAEFPIAEEAWGEVAHVALYDAEVGGNMLFVARAQVAQQVYPGNTYKIPANYMMIRFPRALP